LRKSLTLAGAAATIALLAGCGSSSTTTTGTTAASSTPPATTATAAASTTAAPAVVIATKHGKLGTILAAGPKKLTVYLFEADKGTTPTCSGPCAEGWPPVIATGTPQAGGQAVASDLGTTTRPDGTKQVTYKGHPLYFFVKDKDAGDAYGEGSTAFGAGWYVLKPSGSKVDNDDEDSGEHS
jgi:predicted lipoprotein with Yx(FWY)xxD motif